MYIIGNVNSACCNTDPIKNFIVCFLVLKRTSITHTNAYGVRWSDNEMARSGKETLFVALTMCCLFQLNNASHITTHTRLTYFILLLRSLKTPGLSITFVTLSACRSFEAKGYWTFSHCFHRISFNLLSRLHTFTKCVFTSRTTWARRKTGRLRDILWNVFLSYRWI